MPKPPEVKRSARIAERIRVELEELLTRGAVRDPDAQGVIISNVRVTDDLRLARVNVRVLSGDVDEDRRSRVVAACKRAKGMLRRELGASMKLKFTPELEFYWDSGADHALRMESIFDEIRRERDEK